jgi:hypothetical protein
MEQHPAVIDVSSRQQQQYVGAWFAFPFFIPCLVHGLGKRKDMQCYAHMRFYMKVTCC